MLDEKKFNFFWHKNIHRDVKKLYKYEKKSAINNAKMDGLKNFYLEQDAASKETCSFTYTPQVMSLNYLQFYIVILIF